MDLQADRRTLATTEYNLYDPEHFPGSRGWLAHDRAVRALQAFDAAHPEIVAALEVARAAADHARYEALSDFAKGGG
jgi:hypothetical protein